MVRFKRRIITSEEAAANGFAECIGNMLKECTGNPPARTGNPPPPRGMFHMDSIINDFTINICLLYTSDAADD